ncbi:hypothetical protein KC343_g620 [Hortaea werneckii]|nr:hypothetical protein KC365_g11782 [Hortaea werneckii]KAI7288818.1 hypothetical protein KC352_g4079 [Hortaea werneckii]KAI7572584.1 hypothetical protein KC317_g628 [Hortaea werneckii]KAI7627743.1 hypothetical protein KC346_g589 [Hortaea werneckii]KAI7637584.1 hypothetical protein KC343_g620 [Hortaea werneckii]
MFDINKALANARANVTVRLIKMGYTEKGNLTGVFGENACAEDLFAYASAVMAAVQKLDSEIVHMDKTEKWCKLRVHGVALDRYMAEGGLELERKEIELMAGEQLRYAPRWIKGDTLDERYESGEIKRSTLVLTVKNKKGRGSHLGSTIRLRSLVERSARPSEQAAAVGEQPRKSHYRPTEIDTFGCPPSPSVSALRKETSRLSTDQIRDASAQRRR